MGVDLKALLSDRFGLDLDLSNADALTPALAQILSRRTHRHYTTQPVPEDLIDLLLAVALSASSKSDFQQSSIIKLKDAGKRKRIAEHFPLMPWIGTSPAFLVFCGDARRLERISTLRDHAQRGPFVRTEPAVPGQRTVQFLQGSGGQVPDIGAQLLQIGK